MLKVKFESGCPFVFNGQRYYCKQGTIMTLRVFNAAEERWEYYCDPEIISEIGFSWFIIIFGKELKGFTKYKKIKFDDEIG